MESLPSDSTLTDDDRAAILAIAEATDPEAIVALVWAYYHDADRCDRTPRHYMYLHLGLLSGLVMRVLDDRNRPRGTPI